MKISFIEHHLIQFLKRFDSQFLPLDLFLSHYFRQNRALGSKDRQQIAEAVYGMCRWKALLDYQCGGHPTWEKRYQLFKDLSLKETLSNETIPTHIRVSFPKELFALFEKSFGSEKAMEVALHLNTEAPLTIRINPLKTTREALLKLWEGKYETAPCQYSPLGIQLHKRIPLTSLPEFQEGLFEIQDEASQLIAHLIEAKPAEHVLDYCSGSGGKSLGFAHKLEGKGQIYLHDIRPSILAQAKKRLKRAGIQNMQLLDPQHKNLKRLKQKMDWVLVDAPCSGVGTLRRNPDQKWKFNEELLERLVLEQRQIFEKALNYLKPGGTIVYATCSILPQENEEQLHYFMHTLGLKLKKPPFSSLPAPGSMDGMFAAALTY